MITINFDNNDTSSDLNKKIKITFICINGELF